MARIAKLLTHPKVKEAAAALAVALLEHVFRELLKAAKKKAARK